MNIAQLPADKDFSRCYRCFRPTKFCFCDSIVPIDTGIRFVFLMHPKEAFHQKTGTGRLTCISLKDAEIIVGIDFTENERLNELLSGKGAGAGLYPVVLYPSRDAYFTDSPSFREAIGDKTLLVIVVDATWFFAAKMVELSANLHGLPKVSFKKEYRSRYEFKRQPAPQCLSTIESTYYLIAELQEAGIAKAEADASGLLSTFRLMVNRQLEAEKARLECGGVNHAPTSDQAWKYSS
jgi:DTW domain-containing protein